MQNYARSEAEQGPPAWAPNYDPFYAGGPSENFQAAPMPTMGDGDDAAPPRPPVHQPDRPAAPLLNLGPNQLTVLPDPDNSMWWWVLGGIVVFYLLNRRG